MAWGLKHSKGQAFGPFRAFLGHLGLVLGVSVFVLVLLFLKQVLIVLGSWQES